MLYVTVRPFGVLPLNLNKFVKQIGETNIQLMYLEERRSSLCNFECDHEEATLCKVILVQQTF